MSVETSILRDNIARVRESIAQAGLRLFGENRVQEAASKIPPVAQLTALPLEWHLIGTLQRNKVKSALSLFALLQSVDSLRLAEEISRRAGASPEPVLLEDAADEVHQNNGHDRRDVHHADAGDDATERR